MNVKFILVGFLFDRTQLINDENSYTVVDSHGITKRESSWFDEHLVRAVIKNIIYGSINTVNKSTRRSYNLSLDQNYPNPFNSTTTIRFSIPASSVEMLNATSLQLKIYDILGNEITTLVNEQSAFGGPGTYEIEFDGSALTSGIYFYTITVGQYCVIKNMLLLR